jgi:hypothetical protein
VLTQSPDRFGGQVRHAIHKAKGVRRIQAQFIRVSSAPLITRHIVRRWERAGYNLHQIAARFSEVAKKGVTFDLGPPSEFARASAKVVGMENLNSYRRFMSFIWIWKRDHCAALPMTPAITLAGDPL